MRTFIFVLIAFFGLTAASCGQSSTSEKQEAARDGIMDRAHASVPIPQVNNFVTREAIAEYMRRMDEPNKTFFIYVLADTGNILGYYVSRGAPVNICAFMTPPDRVDYRGMDRRMLRKAPGVDGVYYGGGGCNTEYFFDAETDAMVQIQGLKLFVTDEPLELDVEPFTVRQE